MKNIAAEISNNMLTVFIEGQPWQSVTALFGRENIKVERIVYMEDDPVFHDIITCPDKPETHKRLAFCKNVLSIDALKIKLEQAGFDEPYEVRLGMTSSPLIKCLQMPTQFRFRISRATKISFNGLLRYYLLSR